MTHSMPLIAGRTAQEYNQRRATKGAFREDRYHATAIDIAPAAIASVSVTSKDGEVNEVAISATGDIAGEMSLMTGANRNATVSALSRMRVLEIRKEAIESLLKMSPAAFRRQIRLSRLPSRSRCAP